MRADHTLALTRQADHAYPNPHPYSGKLIMWNKGFSASGVIGEDVVQLLQTQLASRGIELQV